MKKLFKLAVNFTATLLMAVATFSLAACEDIKKVELKLSLYNYSDSAFYAEDDVKFSVELYRHLAPKTADKVLEHVKAGYYNGAIFYQETGYTSQIMMGDLKFENGELKQNLIDGKLPSEIYGEFDTNGTTGSNLVSEKGSIGIWRSYYASDANYKTSSNARNSGRATWYIPTSTVSGYNGYFCVFAQYDTEDAANSKAISAITAIFSNSDYYTEYVIYYTGEYEETKPDENYGLTFNAVLKENFNDSENGYNSEDKTYNGETVFEAEGNQLVSYNYRTVRIPKVEGGLLTAQVKTATVK
ncbi:MAG: peptidylprolyl isomerase [Clostridia bacterium]|nr:peptidylprolyl isomerase [Clostridia bacterium]